MISETVKSFYEYCDKYFCVLIKDVCKNWNEGHLAGFYVTPLYWSECGYIFMYDCMGL